MGRRPTNNPRQIRVKSCGCKLCKEKYPEPERGSRKDCTGPWQARWHDPAGNRKAANLPTKKQAEAHLDAVRTAVRTGLYIDPDLAKEKLTAYRARWREAQGGEPTTLDRDDRMWSNHIKPKWGDYPLSGIQHLEYQAWITHGLKSMLAPGSIIKVHQIMDRMLTAAVRERRIHFNPCDGVRLPTIPKKHPEERRPPSAEQLAAVREHLPAYHHPLEIFLEETGLRWGEAIGLRRCYVDFAARRVHVRQTITEVKGVLRRKAYPKSSAGLRSVGLTPRAVEALEQALARRDANGDKTEVADGLREEELVFRGRNGKALRRNSFRRPWVKAIQEAEIARRVVDPDTGNVDWWPTVHHIRHHFASKLAALGVPEVVTQEIMGHERGGDVTWLYTHAASDVAGQVLAAIEDAQSGRRLRAVS